MERGSFLLLRKSFFLFINIREEERCAQIFAEVSQFY